MSIFTMKLDSSVAKKSQITPQGVLKIAKFCEIAIVGRVQLFYTDSQKKNHTHIFVNYGLKD